MPAIPVTEFQFPAILALLATVCWAVTGAIVARNRGFDFMGVFVLALVSATGGGLIRDGVFLNQTPVMLTEPQHVVIPLAAMAIISIFGGSWERLDWWDKLVNIIDAVGTPAFAMIGFQMSLLAGIPLLGALLVGLVNGVAGGIIRDVLVGDVPQFFRPGQLYGSILIVALLIYWVLLVNSNVSSDAAAWAAIGFAAGVRWLVIRYNWRTFAVNEVHIDLPLGALPEALQTLPGTIVGRSRKVWRKNAPGQPPGREAPVQ